MKFNKSTGAKSTKTVNRAGGESFKETPELAMASLVVTSFANDQYYRKQGETFDELKDILNRLKDKKFAGQAAVYARTRFGMRSITHVLGAEIAHTVKGQDWTKGFFEKLVYRPDDMLETVSYYMKTYGMPLPNSMKKGFAKAFGKFDAYQLAKYRAEGADVSLIDLVNLVHPKPTIKNRVALKQLVEGKLRNKKTWESKLSEAGQADEDEDKDELKGKVWKDLLKTGKLGYFALLKNLRNIIEQSPAALPAALKQLVDEDAIKKSLVLPFRYLTAIEEMEKLSGPEARKAITALNKAIDIATQNVPAFDGETVVLMDASGSMFGMGSNKEPGKIASLFAAIMAKANDCDVIMYDQRAGFVQLNSADSTLTLANKLYATAKQNFKGGTDIHAAINAMNRKYDTIIILSDEQSWVTYNAPTKTLEIYKQKYDATPKVYSFDLQGYGTLQFPQKDVYAIAGFSEKVFDLMKLMAEDRNAMVNEIKKIKL